MKCPDCATPLRASALKCKCGWKASNAVATQRSEHFCPNHPERIGTVSPVLYSGPGPHPGPWYCRECGYKAAIDAMSESNPAIGKRALSDMKAILGIGAFPQRVPGEDEREPEPAEPPDDNWDVDP